MTDVDPERGWSPADDLVSLHTAGNADELHRRLLCIGGAGGNKADAFEPWCLLHQFHKDQPDGAATTAMLLLTERRWRSATGRLVRQIEESGLVPDDQLDLLAQVFLAAGAQVYWEAPSEWFSGPVIVIDGDDLGPADGSDDDESSDLDDGPVVFAREIRPPLRRWAAGRAVRSDSSSWSALVTRARQIGSRGGAAIVHGLLDHADLLVPRARDAVLDLAEGWPHRPLRDAAIALRCPPEAARGQSSATAAVRATPDSSSAQPSLF